MDHKELIQEIRDYCIENQNPEIVKKYSRYFKGEYIAYGLTTQLMQDKLKLLLSVEKVDLQTVLQAGPELIAQPHYEVPSFALLLLFGHKKHFTIEVFRHIESWYKIGIRNWAHSDTLGMMILPVFYINGIIELSDFKVWLKAENPFQRRSVPVTLIKALKKTDDYNVLFEFLSPLMTDPIREVHQGMGWFLREAWKLKPEQTETFLLKYKDVSPRLIFQYACEKMDKVGKEKFKKNVKN